MENERRNGKRWRIRGDGESMGHNQVNHDRIPSVFLLFLLPHLTDTLCVWYLWIGRTIFHQNHLDTIMEPYYPILLSFIQVYVTGYIRSIPASYSSYPDFILGVVVVL